MGSVSLFSILGLRSSEAQQYEKSPESIRSFLPGEKMKEGNGPTTVPEPPAVSRSRERHKNQKGKHMK